MRIATVVLAAGEGRRMGGPKALLPLGSGTFLSRVCRLFSEAGCGPVIAVLGAEASRVAREAGVPQGVTVVVNERWRDGMLTSVWHGLDAAEAIGADAVLLHPVDHPLVEPETVARVVEALRRGAVIVVPSLDGRRGHPGGFSRPLFSELRCAALDKGARVVLDADPGRVVHVAGGSGCLANIDTAADYAARIGSRP